MRPLAILVILFAALPAHAVDSHRVVMVGDVTIDHVGFNPAISKKTRYEGLSFYMERDSRFVYDRPLDRASLTFLEANHSRDAALFDQISRTAVSQPDLYPAPKNMLVFRHPRVTSMIVIRPNGATFLGRQIYVLCDTKQIPFNGRNLRDCHMETQVTDKTLIRVQWSDDFYPAEEWPKLLQAVESGVRQIVISPAQ